MTVSKPTNTSRYKYKIGQRVRIRISAPRWAGWAVENLNGLTGIVEEIKQRDFDIGLGPYCVHIDEPYSDRLGIKERGSWWMKANELTAIGKEER